MSGVSKNFCVNMSQVKKLTLRRLHFLFFSKNVSKLEKELVKNLLGVLKIKEYEKYLGLPVVVGWNKKASLNCIKDRLWGKLQAWKQKLLSQAGKEVFIESNSSSNPYFYYELLQATS